MTGYLGTGQDTLETLMGHHVILGDHGSESLDLTLNLAGRLTETGRRVLVVSLLPDPVRDEPRIENRAATSGYDAAVIRDVRQLPDMEAHLADYDLVLLALPGRSDSRLAP